MTGKEMKSILIILACAFLSASSIQKQSSSFCIKVIDGDTILLDGDETVRLIGVDCLETKDARHRTQPG